MLWHQNYVYGEVRIRDDVWRQFDAEKLEKEFEKPVDSGEFA